MNDFYQDDTWQKGRRDAILVPHFYGPRATEGRYVFMDKGRFASLLQKRYAVDTIAQKGEDTIAIEEKIVRWKGKHLQRFCLETRSCTLPGLESDGWMVYGRADYLLYCFEQPDGSLDCHLIDFTQLRAWFEKNQERYQIHTMPSQNRTESRLVDIKDVYANVQAWRIGKLGESNANSPV